VRAYHRHCVQGSGLKKRGCHRGVGRRAAKNRHQQMGYGCRDYAHWNRKGRISLGQSYLSLRTSRALVRWNDLFVTAVVTVITSPSKYNMPPRHGNLSSWRTLAAPGHSPPGPSLTPTKALPSEHVAPRAARKNGTAVHLTSYTYNIHTHTHLLAVVCERESYIYVRIHL